ncbi:MAG: hypothetical protein AAF363_18005 [Bacteroidota bacterium]
MFRHSLELNQRYMSEGFKMLNELSKQPRLDKNLFVFRPEVYSRAINAFTRLNFDYYNKMMELGFGMTREFFDRKDTTEEAPMEPAFVLTADGKAGGKAALEFILENTKSETVHCELVHSAFKDENNAENEANVGVSFTPQLFTQEPGMSQTVKIDLRIPKNTSPAIYISNVTVLGFEPSYFRIVLNVEPATQRTSHGRSKKRPTK